jgi:hypothetical protein
LLLLAGSLHFAVMFWRKGVAALVVGFVGLAGLTGCGGGSSNASGTYCDKVKELGDFTDRLGEVDPTDLKGSAKRLGELSKDLDEIVTVAPAEIKQQWTAVAAIFTKLNTAMQSVQDVNLSDPSTIDPKTIAVFGELRTAPDQLDEQGEAIDVYTKEACGFAIGS